MVEKMTLFSYRLNFHQAFARRTGGITPPTATMIHQRHYLPSNVDSVFRLKAPTLKKSAFNFNRCSNMLKSELNMKVKRGALPKKC
jgi:hypothetical protein